MVAESKMINLLVNKIHDLRLQLLDYDFNQKYEKRQSELGVLTHELIQSSSIKFDKNKMINLNKVQEDYFKIKFINQRINDYKNIDLLIADDVSDDDLLYVINEMETLLNDIQNYLLETMFTDELSAKYAIISIHSGQGGDESEDWTGMLLRMYLMWSKSHKFEVDIMSIIHSLAVPNGIKRVDILIKGENAYGLLKNETGVHRLIRKSPFSSTQSRHTSFASVKVTPDISNEITVNLDESKDVRIDTERGHGAGGQNRNKLETAVRLFHYETGITVYCQNERSQHKNKENAFKILRSRLYDAELEKQEELKKNEYGNLKVASWGNQIRSYVLHPEQRVKDHRTNHMVNDFNVVLNGGIDVFILKLLIEQTW